MLACGGRFKLESCDVALVMKDRDCDGRSMLKLALIPEKERN